MLFTPEFPWQRSLTWLPYALPMVRGLSYSLIIHQARLPIRFVSTSYSRTPKFDVMFLTTELRYCIDDSSRVTDFPVTVRVSETNLIIVSAVQANDMINLCRSYLTTAANENCGSTGIVAVTCVQRFVQYRLCGEFFSNWWNLPKNA